MTLLRLLTLVSLAFLPVVAFAHDDQRTLVLRERVTASLLNGSFTFKLLKIRGYSVDVRIADERRSLNLGQSFSPQQSECVVTFEEISPETRIARFKTNCP